MQPGEALELFDQPRVVGRARPTTDDADAEITIDAAAVRALGPRLADADDVATQAEQVRDEPLVRELLGCSDPVPATPPRLVVR